jgi:hypothetical protein
MRDEPAVLDRDVDVDNRRGRSQHQEERRDGSEGADRREGERRHSDQVAARLRLGVRLVGHGLDSVAVSAGSYRAFAAIRVVSRSRLSAAASGRYMETSS